jgi:hypothetical protein
MDRRERNGDMSAALLAFGEGLQSTIWTALPGIVQSFDATKRTCVIQPALQAQVMLPDGSTEWVTLPLLVDCPVQFPGGGGMLLTFPLREGDECLVIFASRCIDSWWQSGGIQVQAELRMHDLSDGFCIPGVSSVPNVAPTIKTDAAELRSHDGTVKVSINPTSKAVDVNTPGTATITAATINLNGTLIINGTPYLSHKHSGVSTGVGQTGVVV